MRGDVVRKIGVPLAERLKVVYHNPYDNLADLGRTSNGVPIAINRSYLDCDFRISIGGITPHDFAGFGGGYKTVTVGLSGIRALHETHIERIAEFDAGVARIEGNSHATWHDTLAELKTLHGQECRACVVECASMQLLAP